MSNEYYFDIADSLFNIFSSDNLTNIVTKYQINKYYELNQIHSTIVNIVNDHYQNKLDGDAMITNLKNVALIIKTADCIPIILYDSKKQVLAVVHSGWKGTLNSIVKETIKKMIAIYQADVKDIKAYLYPSIRKCHFEVDEDVYREFKDKIKDIATYTSKKNDKYYIDLQNIVVNDLQNSGITNIKDTNICTYCHHDKFHSYRYNHTNQRNYLIAMIKE